MNFTKTGSASRTKILASSLVLISIVTSGLSCTTIDVLSLSEQLEGEWRVSSYTEERYHSSTNTVSRNEVACGPNDKMVFSDRDRLFVSFDTAGTAAWTYKITDARTLSICGMAGPQG